jgi:hypothetical protein
VILEAKDVQDFVNKILVAFEKSDLDLRDYVHDAKSVEEIPYWLQSQDRFEAVQKMFKEEKVIIAYMNLAEPEMVSKLRGLLQTWHLSLANIDAFYVSNVADWVPPPADVYRHNLEQVFAANHHMIAVYSLRSQNYQNSKVGLVRRVTRECPVSLTETCGIYMEYRKMDIFLKNKASAL